MKLKRETKEELTIGAVLLVLVAFILGGCWLFGGCAVGPYP